MLSVSIIAALLAVATSASPLPLVHHFPRQVNNFTGPTPVSSTSALPSTTATAATDSKASAICTLDPRNPSSWIPSGADAFLDKWFAANDTNDWLHNMDQAFNPASPDFQSTLDCQNLNSNLCQAPKDACDRFPDPEYVMTHHVFQKTANTH